jgi:glutathione S-transferase
MAYFNTMLQDNSFVAGDAFSMADVTVFAGLMFADAAGIAIPEDHSALKAWRARVSELPSVKNRSGQMFVAEDQRRLGF